MNPFKKIPRQLVLPAIIVLTVGLSAAYSLLREIRPGPELRAPSPGSAIYANILDRHGYLLSCTRQNRMNLNGAPLWQVPELMAHAFVIAEDKRFYEHHGVDWLARGQAVLDNIRAGKIVRGASTITEQCIRILHPRPRTIFTRLVETIEAYMLERKYSKEEILEFYLNQIPYSHQCLGVTQAADFYFNRSLETLNLNETLTLAVMIRAPSYLNPLAAGNHPVKGLKQRVDWLAKRMHNRGLITKQDMTELPPLDLKQIHPRTGASHFVQYVRNSRPEKYRSNSRLMTTLDINLQDKLTGLLKTALIQLRHRHVKNGAILVLDHREDEVLAWVNSSDFYSKEDGSQIDAVLALRQPGSTLKPFLYAHALGRGFSAATIISDTPLKHAVGHGLHTFRNYSVKHHGPVRLRCALGNSLNIPAIRVIRRLGVPAFLETLHHLEFDSLNQGPAYYGEGLALGNGEVSLHELVRAYSVLARSGIHRAPNVLISEPGPFNEKRIFSTEVCSIIAHILSDSSARSLEFGGSGLFDFPVQTAIKTGTSTDFRDSWAVGFNDRYTVGVWMGNLDYTPTRDVSGSRGPAMVLRSIFQILNQNRETHPLFVSPGLLSRRICTLSGMAATALCPGTADEWFRQKQARPEACTWHKKEKNAVLTTLPFEYKDWMVRQAPGLRLKLQGGDHQDPGQLSEKKAASIHTMTEPVYMIQPVPGLHLALDPRIPSHLEFFPFEIKSLRPVEKIDWYLNEKLIATTGRNRTRYPWKPQRGRHSVCATVTLKNAGGVIFTRPVSFLVK